MSNNIQVEPGVGIAFSGGGFRATLFHLGSLWRLNELGWLPKLKEVTSVSGGSITAGLLGLKWKRLVFDVNETAINFKEEIVEPLRKFCSRTIDTGSIIGGILYPFHHPSDLITSSYKKYLFGEATLQDLPLDSEGPRFTIYATSLQTGVSVRFSRPYIGEYLIGKIESPAISIAQAVTASSAFPPVLCPVVIKTDPALWKKWDKGAELFSDNNLKSKMLLADGGVYDNLGLERIWDRYKIVLVSDAGAPFNTEPNPMLINYRPIKLTKRSLDIISEQTRTLRKRKLIDDFIKKVRDGAYWGIATHIDDYKLQDHKLPAPMIQDNEVTSAICKLRTRLNSFSDKEQGQLINWGYALTDAGMRRHMLSPSVQSGQWPLPEYAL